MKRAYVVSYVVGLARGSASVVAEAPSSFVREHGDPSSVFEVLPVEGACVDMFPRIFDLPRTKG
jgi:hypothetical protein